MIVKEDELPANTPLVDLLRRIHPEAWADITEPSGWTYSANYVGRITHEAADVIDAALARAVAAERQLAEFTLANIEVAKLNADLQDKVNMLEAERDAWKEKYLRLALNMRRKAFGILGDVEVTIEDITQWAEERSVKNNS